MERSKSIDLLRTLAIVLVCFGRHLTPFPISSPSYVDRILHSITEHLALGGWVGVDLFFVLSGFLVSGLLFREHQKFGKISPAQFLIRRGFKIYPAFWLMILATVSFNLWHHSPQIKATLCELAFIQNYGSFLWWHTWSLAVEEHFYFLLVIFLLLLSRSSKEANPFQKIPMAFLILATLLLAARLLTAHFVPYQHKTNLFPSHLRLDSLFFGVLLSYFYHYHTDPFFRLAHRFKWLFLTAGCASLLPAFIYQLEKTPFIYTGGLTLFYLGSGMMLIASLVIPVPNNKIFRLGAYLGSHSYSIYLWHGTIGEWVVPFLKGRLGTLWSWPIYLVIYVGGTLLVGVMMAALVEFPTLKMRDRWFPSRAQPLES